jgi:hypothetical protein
MYGIVTSTLADPAEAVEPPLTETECEWLGSELEVVEGTLIEWV